MKAWKKAAILGGIWGIASGTIGFFLLLTASGHRPPSRTIEIIFMALFLPGFMGFTIMDRMDDFRLFFILPTIIGIILGLIISKFYSLWAGQNE